MTEIVPVEPPKPEEGGALAIVKSLVEGGLPQVIAGPAGKAISRLIGGVADIPAAWLEARSQAIRDNKDARSAVMKQLSASVGELVANDPAMAQRAVGRWLGDLVADQAKIEGVVDRAVEILNSAPEAKADGKDIKEDWLSYFLDRAKHASDEAVKDRLARMLAGEVLTSGSFALATIQAVAVMDSEVWQIFSEIAEYVVDGGYIIEAEYWNGGVGLAYLQELRYAGLVSDQFSVQQTYTIGSDSGVIVIEIGSYGIALTKRNGLEARCGIFLLTKIGRELLKLVERKNSRDTALIVAQRIKSEVKDVFDVRLGILDVSVPGARTVHNPEVVVAS